MIMCDFNHNFARLVAVSATLAICVVAAAPAGAADVEIDAAEVTMRDLEALSPGGSTALVTATGSVDIPLGTYEPAIWAKTEDWEITISAGRLVRSDSEPAICIATDSGTGISDLSGTISNAGDLVSNSGSPIFLAGGDITNLASGTITS
jgi:hypothetical protein